MSTATQETRPNSALTVPPEERFWKRYSPHGEAPLSMAGSFTLHALAVGVLLLFAVFLASVFLPVARALPIEPVRLAGGGGSNKNGAQQSNGLGKQGEDSVDDLAGLFDRSQDDSPFGLSLTPIAKARLDQFDPPSQNFLREHYGSQTKKFTELQQAVSVKLRSGLGAGKDGGKGPGAGPGKEPGKGKAVLTQREKRMLRWQMKFTANSGAQYLAQLRGLGAILAVPMDRGKSPRYKVIRDLRAPAKLLDEDLSKIKRIYWIDDKPSSVRDVMSALGLALKPDLFIAFMPEKLETELYSMERRYIEKVLRLPFNEDNIDETQFRVVRTAKGYKPELISVRLKK